MYVSVIVNFDRYQTKDFFDELMKPTGKPRSLAMPLIEQINALSPKELRRRQKTAELALYQQGITFSVYGDKKGTEKIIPFDIIPRIVPGDEWQILERGLKQRIEALNLFIDDIYNRQKILKDKIIPEGLIRSSACYLKQCKGLPSRPRASGFISQAPTWCAIMTVISTCWRIICAARRAFPMCCRTAPSRSAPFRRRSMR